MAFAALGHKKGLEETSLGLAGSAKNIPRLNRYGMTHKH
jgi:hypothetical protein